MKHIVNANEMSAIDRYTSEAIGIPSIVLMEKASIKIVTNLLEKLEKSDRIVAICGTGNNGGDGACSARMLYQLGYQVDILLVGDEARLSEQMKLQLKIAKNLGMSILNSAKVCEYNIIIDALFGVGLKRPITGIYETVVNEINKSQATVVSVDLPSGISADTGKVLNVAVKADETITFGYQKYGLLLYPGCEYAGKVCVADIGFPEQARKAVGTNGFYYEQEDVPFLLPERKAYSNKGTYGKVLIVAGSKEISGACYLSAKAALRAGAGLVKVLTDEANRMVIKTLLPEALTSFYNQDTFEDETDLMRMNMELKWADAIVIGPGIGTDSLASKLLNLVLSRADVPVVIDADGLNLLSMRKEEDVDPFLGLNRKVILTPHLKEMSRMINQPVSYVAENILEVTRTFTGNKKLVLALKDARTVVSDGTETYVNLSGNNGMATGGSGDVLTGIMGAFLAQGLEIFEAACIAVYVHGLAGNEAAQKKNCYSLMASDIIDALSTIM